MGGCRPSYGLYVLLLNYLTSMGSLKKKMYIIGSLLIRLVTLRCIISFMSQRQHLLMCLLGLEGILLSLIFIYFTFSSPGDLFILFSILRFAACEARLGLSCLVMIVRSFGSDIFSCLRGCKC